MTTSPATNISSEPVLVIVILPAPEMFKSPLTMSLIGRSIVMLGDNRGIPIIVRSPLVLYTSAVGADSSAATSASTLLMSPPKFGPDVEGNVTSKTEEAGTNALLPMRAVSTLTVAGVVGPSTLPVGKPDVE